MKESAITYSCVAFGQTVLAEAYVGQPGNFMAVARRILADKVDSSVAHKKTYIFQDQLYCYSVNGHGLVALCRADQGMSANLCYEFLNEMLTTFLGTYEGEYQTGTELSFNDRFHRKLKDRMDFYSSDPSASSLTEIHAQVNRVTENMKKNIDTILQTGEQIETLVHKVEDIDAVNLDFRKQAVKVKHKVWWKNAKLWVLVFVVIGIVAAVVVIVLLLALRSLIPG